MTDHSMFTEEIRTDHLGNTFVDVFYRGVHTLTWDLARGDWNLDVRSIFLAGFDLGVESKYKKTLEEELIEDWKPPMTFEEFLR